MMLLLQLSGPSLAWQGWSMQRVQATPLARRAVRPPAMLRSNDAMVSNMPSLAYAAKIESFAPSLRDVVHTLTWDDIQHVDALFSELTSYTHYLTGWPGNTAEAELRFALEVAYLAHHGLSLIHI